MPTYTFTRTRAQLSAKILRTLGVADSTGACSPEDLAIVAEAMDMRLKELHALGILWWNVSGATTDLALTSGNASATIATTDFLFPVTMNLRVGTEDQHIEIIDHRTYQAIPNKSDTGEPEMVFVNGSACLFWPTPDANYTVKMTYEAIAADTESGSAPDVRTECLRALSSLIEGDLVDTFDVPEPKASRLVARASSAIQTIHALTQQRVESKTTAPDWY
ncbi:MAG: hypothetical protein RLZZ182_538 [Pseudomonadota bacterium]|jgi:hypothetical protein